MQRWLDVSGFLSRHGEEFLSSLPHSPDAGQDAAAFGASAAPAHFSGASDAYIAPFMRSLHDHGQGHAHVGIDTQLNFDEGLARPWLFHDVLYTPPSMQHLFDFIS